MPMGSVSTGLHTHLFELDQPQMFALKEQILSSTGATPSCWRQTIGVDLNAPWTDVLLGAGFDPLHAPFRSKRIPAFPELEALRGTRAGESSRDRLDL